MPQRGASRHDVAHGLLNALAQRILLALQVLLEHVLVPHLDGVIDGEEAHLLVDSDLGSTDFRDRAQDTPDAGRAS